MFNAIDFTVRLALMSKYVSGPLNIWVCFVGCDVFAALSVVTANSGVVGPKQATFHLPYISPGIVCQTLPKTRGKLQAWNIPAFPPTLYFSPLERFSHTFQPMLRVAGRLESVSMITLMFMALGVMFVSAYAATLVTGVSLNKIPL